jgi:DedD protein
MDDKGLTARHLILVFLAGVAVCAVFFSLGFMVGYNEHSARTAAIAAETVNANAGVIPPTVNPPAGGTPAGKANPDKADSVAPPTPVAGGAEDQIPTETIQEGKPLPPERGHVAETGGAKPAPAPSTAPKASVPATRAAAPAASSVGSGFTVQVAASRARPDAESLVDILKNHGYPVFLVAPENSRAGDNLYRVQVGPFHNRADAERVREQLAKEGFKPFIPKH